MDGRSTNYSDLLRCVQARLLHTANSHPPVTNRESFYALKDRLLAKNALRVEDAVQEIKKDCWGTYQEGCRGKYCDRCGGSGIFDHFFVKLATYQWAGYRFHRPLDRCRPSAAPDIIGRIEHRDYGNLSAEASLWLYLLTGEIRLLAEQLRSSARPCAQWWLPGLQLQRIVFFAWLKRSRRCHTCSRWSLSPKGCPSRCRRCWQALFDPKPLPVGASACVDGDIPF